LQQAEVVMIDPGVVTMGRSMMNGDVFKAAAPALDQARAVITVIMNSSIQASRRGKHQNNVRIRVLG
jgi:hypothetical protein